MRRWGIGTIALLVACSGCKAFDEDLLSDSGRGADTGAAACPLVRPPERPDVEDGEDVDEVIFFVRDVVVDQRDDRWRTIGYDLDGLCTTEEVPQIECDPATASAPIEIDGEGGIDNTAGHNVFPVVLSAQPDFMDRASSGTNQGLGALMFRLRSWNGTADDPRVDITFAQSVFGAGEAIDEPLDEIDVSGGRLRVNGVERSIPQWDGGDYFWLSPQSFLQNDLTRPRLRNDNAYMADRTIVLRLTDRFPIRLGGDETGVTLSLTDSVFTATLSEDFSRVESATLAGRFAILDVLDSIEGLGVCPDSTDFGVLERLLQLAADVRSVPGTGGPGVACDAVSIAVVYRDGAPGTIAGLQEPFEIADSCNAMDAGVPDAGTPDASTPDSGVPDAGATDAGIDAGTDAG